MSSALITRSRLAALLLALGAAAPAFADNTDGPLTTVNTTNQWIWITVYDVTRTIHIDYGWVPPCRARAWNNSGWRGFIRAEVKASTDQSRPPGDTPNVFDTTMKDPGKMVATVALVGSRSSYYLTQDVPIQSRNCRAGAYAEENCCTGQMDGGYKGGRF
jgi:hypothetical protein